MMFPTQHFFSKSTEPLEFEINSNSSVVSKNTVPESLQQLSQGLDTDIKASLQSADTLSISTVQSPQGSPTDEKTLIISRDIQTLKDILKKAEMAQEETNNKTTEITKNIKALENSVNLPISKKEEKIIAIFPGVEKIISDVKKTLRETKEILHNKIEELKKNADCLLLPETKNNVEGLIQLVEAREEKFKNYEQTLEEIISSLKQFNDQF